MWTNNGFFTCYREHLEIRVCVREMQKRQCSSFIWPELRGKDKKRIKRSILSMFSSDAALSLRSTERRLASAEAARLLPDRLFLWDWLSGSERRGATTEAQLLHYTDLLQSGCVTFSLLWFRTEPVGYSYSTECLANPWFWVIIIC